MKKVSQFYILLLHILSLVPARANVECPIGFGSSETHVLADDRINDNFCDCPTNGADEPATNACAGIEYWPGHSSDSDTNPSVVVVFTCPQQPTVQLASSKVHDGICDCCDGADELHGTCEDNCAEILAAEREKQQKAKAAFELGYAKRQKTIQDFESLKISVAQQTREKDAELILVEEKLVQARRTVDEWKGRYAANRLATVETVSMAIATTSSKTKRPSTGSLITGLLDALSDEELFKFILHACQTAGEMEDADDTKTCGPLRLAGLDAGLRWEPSTYEINVIRDSDEDVSLLADLFYQNLKDGKKWWNKRNKDAHKVEGRRLMRHDDDAIGDDYIATDDLYLEDDMPDDDEDDQGSALDASQVEDPTQSNEEDSGGLEREELKYAVLQKDYSRSRNSFLQQAKGLLESIEAAAKEGEEREQVNGEDQSDSEELESVVKDESADKAKDSNSPDFDPMALPLVKSKLQQLEKRITRGLDYGVSAKVLLDSLDSYFKDNDALRYYLLLLTVGTINHGKLSSVHVWQIMQSVVPELQVDGIFEQDAQTCQSLWLSICPPKTVQRKVGPMSIALPNAVIVKEAQAFCQTVSADGAASAACAVDGSIPSQIPDGYMGYIAVEPRTESDPLQTAFAPLSLSLDDAADKELKDLEEQVSAVSKEKKALEGAIADLKSSIGGDNPEKFGLDGELNAIKDECFSILSGKYTYELCMFGRAKQKEGTSAGGTDLGKWAEATRDEETGQRVWTWKDGAKCWNGPQRSATAFVTCGDETTIISADEPETCKYEFQVESYIGCDDAFRVQNHLK